METTQRKQPLEQHETGSPVFESQNIRTDKLRVLNIQRSCVHDGPGIRTTIFFQGCALRCLWCQNPEALSFQPDIAPDSNYSISDIMEVVLRDKEYYFKTNGGVTLSGGEPLLQDPGSVISLLELLRKEKIHVSAETALHAPWENISKIAPYIDLFLIDLKVVGDDTLHKKYTQQDSKLIHSNISKLIDLNADAKIKFRMVIVPGFNDMDSSIKATADFLTSINYNSIELLKYHNMYEEKAKGLRLVQGSLNITPKITPDQSLAAIRSTVELFKSFDINAQYVDLDSFTNKAVFTRRVYDIQNDIRESDYHLCLEAAKLKTKFYKKNGFKKPNPIHRSERLSYVLENKEVIIYPNELLVGNFTSKRVGGQLWEEHCGVMFSSIIHQINRQTPISFQISLKDKFSFYFKIFPFWIKHSLFKKVYSSFSDLMLTIAQASDLSTGFNNNMAAIAHFVVNSERVLELGTIGIIKEIETMQKEKPENNQDFYNGAIIALKGLESFAKRYSDHLLILSQKENDPKRRKELEEMSGICRHVPKHPARTYHEALQSMMFLQIGLCIESFENAVSFGRLDQILYPYYKEDKNAGLMTYEKAKELLALFILKMDEAVLVNDGDTYLRIGRLFETQSTDQAVTAGGLGKDGKDATNDLTYMLLDICELQPLAVNMTARIHKDSPIEYLDRLAEVYINGAPMPSLYNDELYIKTLQKYYPETTIQDSRNYAVIGCVEPNASDDHFGNTDCANINVVLPFLQALKGEEHELWHIGFFDQLERINNKAIEYNLSRWDNKFFKALLSKHTKRRINKKIKKASSSYNFSANMDELLKRYQKRLNHLASSILADHQKIEKILVENFTTPLASTLFKGCIESGKDVNEGGATINSAGIQAVGITDVGDSLHALDEVVYKKKLYTIDDIIKAMDNNFEGKYYQQIRSALLEVPKFGDDGSFKSQEWVNKSLEIFVNALNSVKNCPRDGIYTAGYYALNVNIIYGLRTPALPSGRLRGVPLANSVAPHYGMEVADLLSSLNSVANADFVNYAPNGTTVTFTIDSGLFQGPDGVRNLSGMISTYFDKGGMQFQPNVINREILLDAYNHPEKHKYLMVRVAGYCSYFNNISDELKLAIINRTCYC
ncbi:MAG: radical SAM protein [Desulfobacteraceae bacterium]|nr:radical SAM protein [Desulfobacteraceae bacterium]